MIGVDTISKFAWSNTMLNPFISQLPFTLLWKYGYMHRCIPPPWIYPWIYPTSQNKEGGGGFALWEEDFIPPTYYSRRREVLKSQ